jgi:Putative prokaryotic signal transducing protein
MHVSTSWKTLLRFTTVHEAEIARGALEAHDIPVQLLDTQMVGVADYLSNAIGGVRLQVPAEEEHNALRVLSTLGGAEEWDEEDADDEEDDDEEELPEEAVNAADALARRAMVAALAGIFIPFVLHLYSVVILAQFARLGIPASPKGRRHVLVAVGLDALFLGPVLALAVRYFGW